MGMLGLFQVQKSKSIAAGSIRKSNSTIMKEPIEIRSQKFPDNLLLTIPEM